MEGFKRDSNMEGRQGEAKQLHHIIESQQFNLPVLNELFETTQRMEKIVVRRGTNDYAGRIMALQDEKS